MRKGNQMMKLILSSSIGGSVKENGVRIPVPLFTDNGFLDMLKQDWVEDAKVLMIVSSPDDSDKNDVIYGCYAQAFPFSGLSIASMDLCDGSYIVVDNGRHTLFGEAYCIRDGTIEMICTDGGSIVLKGYGHLALMG